MTKDVLRALESGVLAEIGLLAFLIAFVLIVIRVMTMNKRTREQAKQMPLDDADEIIFPTNDHHAEPKAAP